MSTEVSILVERRDEVQGLITLLGDLQRSYKSQGKLDKLADVDRRIAQATVELQGIADELADREAEVKLDSISKLIDKLGDASPAAVLKSVLSKSKIDFGCKLILEFVAGTGDVVSDLRPSTVRTTRVKRFIRSAIGLPKVLIVRSFKDNGKYVTYERTGDIATGETFTTAENAFAALLGCFGTLLRDFTAYNEQTETETGKKSKYQTASATDRLARLTRGVESFGKYFERIPDEEQQRELSQALKLAESVRSK